MSGALIRLKPGQPGIEQRCRDLAWNGICRKDGSAYVSATIDGGSGDAAAHKGLVEMVAGFGLLQDLIIDQQFSERGRMGRLLSVYAANPGLLSIGLDEDTAVVIDRQGMLEVVGDGMVTSIDGRNAQSGYFERDLGDVLTVVNSHLFVLGPGRRFHLDKRQPVVDWSPAG